MPPLPPYPTPPPRISRPSASASVKAAAEKVANPYIGMTMTHYYAWKNNPKCATLYGRPLRIICYGRMNSILVEFTDNGQREVISRNAVRKRRCSAGTQKLIRNCSDFGRPIA